MGARSIVCFLLAGLTAGPVVRLTQGYFLAMISESQFYILSQGQSAVLECNFHADQYDLFEHPVLWRKEQLEENLQVNILSNINEPFVATNRFEVSFVAAEPRYQLELSISDVVREDSGNYTCEVRGPHSVVLAQVMHHLFVRAPVDSVSLSGYSIAPTTSPSFSQPRTPPVLRLTEGHPFTLRCLSSGGYPPPTVTIWVDRRDITADLSIKTDVGLSGTRGLRLITHRIDRWTNAFLARATDDGATVKCSVTVPGLSPHVELTKLDVEYSPKITCSPTEAYTGDTNVDVRCEVKSKPRSTSYFWILTNNGTTLSPGEVTDEFWATDKDREDGVLEVNLVMRRAGPDKFRKYTIVAENSVAISRKDVELIQIFKSSAKQPLSDDASRHVSERVASRDTGQRGSKVTKNTAPHAQTSNRSSRMTSLNCISAILLSLLFHLFAALRLCSPSRRLITGLDGMLHYCTGLNGVLHYCTGLDGMLHYYDGDL